MVLYYSITAPPLTFSVSPVVSLNVFEQKPTIALAISWGIWYLPIGILWSQSCSTSSLVFSYPRSILQLISLSIISVFKMNVFIRSALLLVLLSYLYPYFGFISPLFQIMIVIFNIFIYIISTKSSNSRLNNLDEQIGEIDKVIH